MGDALRPNTFVVETVNGDGLRALAGPRAGLAPGEGGEAPKTLALPPAAAQAA